MAKKNKDSHPLSIRMENKIYERLNLFCEESGLSKTAVVEKAVNMLIEDYESKMKKTSKK